MNITKDVMRHVKVGTKCDVCGSESKDSMPTVTWYHSDWGNDSVESYEHRDVCTAACYRKAIEGALASLDDYQQTGEINDMPYWFARALFLPEKGKKCTNTVNFGHNDVFLCGEGLDNGKPVYCSECRIRRAGDE